MIEFIEKNKLFMKHSFFQKTDFYETSNLEKNNVIYMFVLADIVAGFFLEGFVALMEKLKTCDI